MTQPPDADRIVHIIEACEQAAEFTAGRTRDDLEHDRMLQLALTKLVEIIGEAAKAVSTSTRARYPDVPVVARCPDAQAVDPIPSLLRIDLDSLWESGTDSPPAVLAALRAPGA